MGKAARNLVSGSPHNLLTAFQCRNAQAQRVKLDKATGIRLIIGTGIIFKRGDVFIEQAVV